ncbi:hypothetical protein DV451_003808 [Geotrichum candidum]|uniref:Similar to Saccharomyces cerevisiae YHR071W PCL5 Cyclin, interacts with and phosphorylated by Pho85p cyclin-dependent kinase (Cdk) n=1 Tax=Geotrichum candidum TaxID=1173061 RepID=A0A0J9XFN1_GEOCN|nr:hypothetical protein DV451_003808 [Geotrichum candidum]CDO56094.1 similar to Saccharomyces cerevisiae YHR071W PCL5 Cyclin, interacts with and phosphorylated by Pho85p cyclin-dependent kinase (Cdk) [Geotrichum candidum]
MNTLMGTASSPLATPLSSKSSSSSNSSTRSNDSTNTPASSVTDHESPKTDLVEALVTSSCAILQSIWTSATSTTSSKISLKSYIQELLKRSRTSYSTLQIALYYLSKRVPMQKLAACEPRRTFLSALLIASKYNQDRTYSAGAWSKMSGLPTLEINRNELALLKAMDWDAHVSYSEYEKWSSELLQMSFISRKRRSSINSITDNVEPSVVTRPVIDASYSRNYAYHAPVMTNNTTTVTAGTKRKANCDNSEPADNLCKRRAIAKNHESKNFRIYQWIVDVARETSKV